MTSSIHWIKTVGLLGLICFLPFSISAQCYDALKKEGDRFNQKAVYEEAITQYLAALLCPGLEQEQRITLINLIKSSQKARVAQLENAVKRAEEAEREAKEAEQEAKTALADLRKATESIFATLMEGAEEDILNLDYEGALRKIQDAAQLKINEEQVGLAMMELVYFFNEIGRHSRAISLSGTLSNLLKLGRLSMDQDSLNSIRTYLSEAQRARYQELEARYYPLMVDVPGGTFEMGCNPKIDTFCRGMLFVTLHQVQLRSYRLAKYETTNW